MLCPEIIRHPLKTRSTRFYDVFIIFLEKAIRSNEFTNLAWRENYFLLETAHIISLREIIASCTSIWLVNGETRRCWYACYSMIYILRCLSISLVLKNKKIHLKWYNYNNEFWRVTGSTCLLQKAYQNFAKKIKRYMAF